MNIEKFARRQIIISNLRMNLRDLYDQQNMLFIELAKIDLQIEKHLSYLEKLEEEDKE